MRKERVGFAVCGSFCTHERVLKALEALTEHLLGGDEPPYDDDED